MDSLNCSKEDMDELFEQLTNADYFILGAREYWIMTEVFVHLHGSDACENGTNCPHCEFISNTFRTCS